MVILVKNLGNGIKNITINDPKTYNSLSFATLRSLLNTFDQHSAGREFVRIVSQSDRRPDQ